MSTQEEVNASAYQYVLYYIGIEQKDASVYPTDLDGICVLSFAEGDIIECKDWTIEAYPAPSNDQLLKYKSSVVLAWYDGVYVLPGAISDYQYYKISAEALASVRTDTILPGFKVFDTTNSCQRSWDGNAWVSP